MRKKNYAYRITPQLPIVEYGGKLYRMDLGGDIPRMTPLDMSSTYMSKAPTTMASVPNQSGNQRSGNGMGIAGAVGSAAGGIFSSLASNNRGTIAQDSSTQRTVDSLLNNIPFYSVGNSLGDWAATDYKGLATNQDDPANFGKMANPGKYDVASTISGFLGPDNLISGLSGEGWTAGQRRKKLEAKSAPQREALIKQQQQQVHQREVAYNPGNYWDENSMMQAEYGGALPILGQSYAMGGPLYKGKPTANIPEIDQFTKDYTNSTNFENLSKGMGDTDEMIEMRREDVNRFDRNHDIKISKKRGGASYVDDGKMILNNDIGDWKSYDDVAAHEFGHLGVTDGDLLLPEKAREEMTSRNQTYKKFQTVNGPPSEDDIHDMSPQETRADLFQFRRQLQKHGIYNSVKGGEFTEKHLEKFKKTKDWNRLRRLYKPEDVIWMMNNIAENKQGNAQLQIAALGGPLETGGRRVPLQQATIQNQMRRNATMGDTGFVYDLPMETQKHEGYFNSSDINELNIMGNNGGEMPINKHAWDNTSPFNNEPIMGTMPSNVSANISPACERQRRKLADGTYEYRDNPAFKGMSPCSNSKIYEKEFGGELQPQQQANNERPIVTEYNTGGQHSENQSGFGGVPVDDKGNKVVVSGNRPIASVEQGEISWFNPTTKTAYVFSNKLFV